MGPRNRITLALCALMLAISAAVQATARQAPDPVGLDDVGFGSLMIATKRAGEYLPAPIVATTVDIDISGIVTRARIAQRFYNPTQQWIEALYVFPLPENAAVDELRMRIGDRFIEGRIKEREAARATYDAAKRAGKRAALLQQERPNMFTSAIANIGPGETVVVEIGYQHRIDYDGGRFGMRFPMVVGPRFDPRGEPTFVSHGSDLGAVKSSLLPQPPLRGRDQPKGNPVFMSVSLNAGVPLAYLRSPSHDIAVTEHGPTRRSVTLTPGAVPADRDFVLEWGPYAAKAPSTALFQEYSGGDTYLLAMLLPPTMPGSAPRRPRETIFVIDTSGSMKGDSIAQARTAFAAALDNLHPQDRFNIVQFNSMTTTLWREAKAASPGNISQATFYLKSLIANGGTVMGPALTRALRDDAGSRRHLRQIIFFTDGAITNEAELFRLISERIGESRLFTVGMGSAPNSFFMERAARLGRGGTTHIGDMAEIGPRMARFLAKLEHPVLTDISLSANGAGDVDIWPRALPDLYAGDPVTVVLRLPGRRSASGSLQVSGRFAGKGWSARLPLSESVPARGIRQIWAREKIGALMDDAYRGRGGGRGEVLAVATKHGLVSAFTSLVAVDVTPARPSRRTLSSLEVPLNLPKGWSHDGLFRHIDLAKATWHGLRRELLKPAGGSTAGGNVSLGPGFSSRAGGSDETRSTGSSPMATRQTDPTSFLSAGTVRGAKINVDRRHHTAALPIVKNARRAQRATNVSPTWTWSLDRSGPRCFGGQPIALTSSLPGRAGETLTFAIDDHVQRLVWPSGETLIRLPRDLPLRDGATLTISFGGLRLGFPLHAVANDISVSQLASDLAGKGCQDQAVAATKLALGGSR